MATRRKFSPSSRDFEAAPEAPPEELDLFWRGGPEFIGPVAPPMWLWMHDREKQRLWQIATNLDPKPEGKTDDRMDG